MTDFKVHCHTALKDDKSEINISTPWTSMHYGDATFINLPSSQLPDDKDTVVEFEIE